MTDTCGLKCTVSHGAPKHLKPQLGQPSVDKLLDGEDRFVDGSRSREKRDWDSRALPPPRLLHTLELFRHAGDLSEPVQEPLRTF